MDHRSFALTRLARKPGCPEAIPGKPADFSGMWLEPHGPDEPLRAAQWQSGFKALTPATFMWLWGVGLESRGCGVPRPPLSGPLVYWELWQQICTLMTILGIKC